MNWQICWPVRAFGFSLGLDQPLEAYVGGRWVRLQAERVQIAKVFIGTHPDQNGTCSAAHGRSVALVKSCQPEFVEA